MPVGADITVALAGAGTTTRLTLLRRADGTPAFERTTADPLNPIINTSGELNYAAQSPQSGIPWQLDDFSHGLGPFLFKVGYCYYGLNVDTRHGSGLVIPGLPDAVDGTGIAANEKVVKRFHYNGTNYLITSTTVYTSTGGGWTQIGANGASWTVGNPTDIIVFPTTAGVTCIVVAMGASVVWQYSVDGGTNCIASTRAGNAKYANYFCFSANSGTTTPVLRYVTNPNLQYSSADALNATAVTTGNLVGDYLNDEFNSLVEDVNGVLLMGKRRFLYSIDSLGNVRTVAGPYRYYATSEAGSFTGYPTRPSNANFQNPAVSGHGLIVYPVEDYRLILRSPDGTITEDIQPYAWADAPRLQMPINAHCWVANELYVAMGSNFQVGVGGTSNRSTTYLTGGAGLLGNDLTTAQSDIYAGRMMPDGTWEWHGSLLREANLSGGLIRYLWFDDANNYLYRGAATQAAVNVAQRRSLMQPGGVTLSFLPDQANPGFSITATWTLETGRYQQNQPNVTKTLRSADTLWTRPTSGPTLAIKYTTYTGGTASYSTLATYSTGASNLTSTAFPASTTFNGVHLQWVGTPGSGSAAILRATVITHLFYPVRYANVTFTVDASEGQASRSGGQSHLAFQQLKTFIDNWEAETEPATVTDVVTTEVFSVNLIRATLTGVGKYRRCVFQCVEVR